MLPQGVSLQRLARKTRYFSEPTRWEIAVEGTVVGWIEERHIPGARNLLYNATGVHPQTGARVSLENATGFGERITALVAFHGDPMSARQHLDRRHLQLHAQDAPGAATGGAAGGGGATRVLRRWERLGHTIRERVDGSFEVRNADATLQGWVVPSAKGFLALGRAKLVQEGKVLGEFRSGLAALHLIIGHRATVSAWERVQAEAQRIEQDYISGRSRPADLQHEHGRA